MLESGIHVETHDGIIETVIRMKPWTEIKSQVEGESVVATVTFKGFELGEAKISTNTFICLLNLIRKTLKESK
jgi:hypothetical protein